MDHAKKYYGYRFEILRGYTFQTNKIFKEYIETMYNLRLKYPKYDPMNDIAKKLMNSLYGRFGMRSALPTVEVFDMDVEKDRSRFQVVQSTYGEFIQDLIVMDTYVVVVRQNHKNVNNSSNDDCYHFSDVNVAIAATITAAGRTYMSLFKNQEEFDLYYTDTDSIVINKPLSNPAFVGTALGQLKLEHELKEAVFLAPKVYAIKTISNQEIVKVKGVTKEAIASEGLNFDKLDQLRAKDVFMEFNQEKWFKKLYEGSITISDVSYHLKATSNKRLAEYSFNGHTDNFVSTRPYHYEELEGATYFTPEELKKLHELERNKMIRITKKS